MESERLWIIGCELALLCGSLWFILGDLGLMIGECGGLLVKTRSLEESLPFIDTSDAFLLNGGADGSILEYEAAPL